MDRVRLLVVSVLAVMALAVVGSGIELFRTTFLDPEVGVASVATTAFVAVGVFAAVVVGARSREWLSNPYW